MKKIVSFTTAALVLASLPVFALEPYDVPILSCESATGASITLKICGGAVTGAPAGISLHWRTEADNRAYIAAGGNGWGGEICELSLSGQPSMQHPDKSRWELLANECETITIGDINFDETGVSGNECAMDPLLCGTTYVFRTFAHAGRGWGRSAFSGPTYCTTADCAPSGEGCSFTQGYWKNHGPDGTGVYDCQSGQNDNEWPLTSITLGNTTYTDSDACAIMNTAGGGNFLLPLAHQLIAAKLNVANNTETPCQDVLDDIAAADALIGDLVVPPIGSGSLTAQQASALNNALTAFNEGDRCDGTWLHCDTDPTPGGAPRSPTAVESSSWGMVKGSYR